MPLGFPIAGFESGQRYQPTHDDIVVTTYPKCGTTWMQYIVYLLVRRKALTATQTLTSEFPHLEEVGAGIVDELPLPRLIKTHLPLARSHFSGDARYVLVVRNPFDCAVSFYHHTVGFPVHYDFADGDFDTFFECFLAGEVDFGDYFDHLVPWVEAAASPNVLLVQYESLRADPRAGIAAVAGFLDVDVSQPAPAANRDFLEWVVDESSIGSMRRNQSRWSSERPTALPFVRRGSVGGWQSIFSGRQTRQLAERFRERTRGTAAAALWPDIMDAASQVRGPAQQ